MRKFVVQTRIVEIEERDGQLGERVIAGQQRETTLTRAELAALRRPDAREHTLTKWAINEIRHAIARAPEHLGPGWAEDFRRDVED